MDVDMDVEEDMPGVLDEDGVGRWEEDMKARASGSELNFLNFALSISKSSVPLCEQTDEKAANIASPLVSFHLCFRLSPCSIYSRFLAHGDSIESNFGPPYQLSPHFTMSAPDPHVVRDSEFDDLWTARDCNQ